jgi:hypothetical protein
MSAEIATVLNKDSREDMALIRELEIFGGLMGMSCAQAASFLIRATLTDLAGIDRALGARDQPPKADRDSNVIMFRKK